MAGAESNDNDSRQFLPGGSTRQDRAMPPILGPARPPVYNASTYVPVLASPQGMNSPGVSPRRAARQRARSQFFAAQRHHHMPTNFSSLGPPPTHFMPVGPNLTVPQGFTWPAHMNTPPSFPVLAPIYPHPQPHAVMPPNTSAAPAMTPPTPAEPRSVMTPTERMSGRTSRPLVPTVEPFQPAFSLMTPVVGNTTTRSNEGKTSQISGSPIPQAKIKTTRPLSAEVAPFEPSSVRIAYELVETPSKRSGKKGLNDTPQRSSAQREAHSFMPFLEEARLNEASSPFSNLNLNSQIPQAARRESEGEGRGSFVIHGSTSSTPDRRSKQRVSPEQHRRVQSLDEGVPLAIPAPVYHAHQEMAYSSHASSLTARQENENVNSYASSPVNLGGPAMTLDYGPWPLRLTLTAAEAEVLNMAAERQAKQWQEAERIESERLEMEKQVAEKRELVQRTLDARQNARLKRESYDFTRPEVLTRDHKRRDEYAAREAARGIEFESQLWYSIYPFWSEQPNPRLPRAHTRSICILSQEMVSSFETLFRNMASYRDGYTNYQTIPAPLEISQPMSQLPRHQPGWMPGPTRTNWDHPSICDNPESRRTVLDTGCFIPYMGPTGVTSPPHPRDPCIEPLIGQETLPQIPPFNPGFLTDSSRPNISTNSTSIDTLSREEAIPRPQHPQPTSVQSTPPHMRRPENSTLSGSARANSHTTNFENEPPCCPASMARKTMYPQSTQGSNSTSVNSPPYREKRRRRRR